MSQSSDFNNVEHIATTDGNFEPPLLDLPFSDINHAVTFSDLAGTNNQPSSAIPQPSSTDPPTSTNVGISSSSNIMYDTLQEYGPPIPVPAAPTSASEPAQPQQTFSSGSLFTSPQMTITPIVGLSSSTIPFSSVSTCDFLNITSGLSTAPMSTATASVSSASIASQPISYDANPIASNVFIPPTSRDSGPADPPRSDQIDLNQPLYSPPPPRKTSPPLDSAPRASQDTNKTPSRSEPAPQPSTSSNPNKIPKRLPTSHSESDRYDEMDLVTLQSRFRELESRQRTYQTKRAVCEKDLNDMTRNAQGKDIELDPNFREKKDEQKRCDFEIRETKIKLRKITDKLQTKFNFKMAPFDPASSVTQNRRAKMSTTTATPPSSASRKANLSKEDMNRKRTLAIHDHRTWCKICDLHFNNLNDFCDHLHHREHLSNMKGSAPWRVEREKLHQGKTFDLLKSFCDRTANETKTKFSLGHLEKILNPNYSGEADRQKVKERALERERGRFQKDDPLFLIKGFDHLLPIAGFYCQLCDRACCDKVAANQHLRSYEHTYKFVQMAALNPQAELTFRTRWERSLKSEEPENQNEPVEAPVSSSRSSHQQSGAYKKATSRIVDEHETVANLFPTRKVTKTTSSGRRKDGVSRSDDDEEGSGREVKRRRIESTSSVSGKAMSASPERRPQRKIPSGAPEIVPIGGVRSQTAALKRLRSDKESSNLLADRRRDRAALEAAKSKDSAGTARNKENDTRDKSFSSVAKTTALLARVDEDDEVMECDDDGGDVMILEEVHLNSGDPDSPFPHLDLSVTGHVHSRVLKDKKLAQRCVVKMNRISMEDYKDMLLESASLWSRVSHLMAKKETILSAQLSENNSKGAKQTSARRTAAAKDKTGTKATYFSLAGESIPINLDKNRNRHGGRERSRRNDLGKPTASSSGGRRGAGSSKSRGEEIDQEQASTTEEEEEEEERKKKGKGEKKKEEDANEETKSPPSDNADHQGHAEEPNSGWLSDWLSSC